jgi:uncharacterized protein with NRDE domain
MYGTRCSTVVCVSSDRKEMLVVEKNMNWDAATRRGTWTIPVETRIRITR